MRVSDITTPLKCFPNEMLIWSPERTQYQNNLITSKLLFCFSNDTSASADSAGPRLTFRHGTRTCVALLPCMTQAVWLLSFCRASLAAEGSVSPEPGESQRGESCRSVGVQQREHITLVSPRLQARSEQPGSSTGSAAVLQDGYPSGVALLSALWAEICRPTHVARTFFLPSPRSHLLLHGWSYPSRSHSRRKDKEWQQTRPGWVRDTSPAR